MLRGRTEKRCDDSPCTRFPSRRTAREPGRRKNAVVGLRRASLNSAATDSSPSAPTSRTDAACIYCTCHVPYHLAIHNNGPIIRDGLQPSLTVWLYNNLAYITFFVFLESFCFFSIRRHPQWSFRRSSLRITTTAVGRGSTRCSRKRPRACFPSPGARSSPTSSRCSSAAASRRWVVLMVLPRLCDRGAHVLASD